MARVSLTFRAIRPEPLVPPLPVSSAEYDVIPHLIKSGAAHLIDELFIEVHTEINSCCKPPHDAGRHRSDALRLIQMMRDVGVYAHEWC